MSKTKLWRTFSVRLESGLAERMEDKIESLGKEHPGVNWTQTDVIRMAVTAFCTPPPVEDTNEN